LVATTATIAYNDLEALKALFEKDGQRIAAVIVEPVAGNMGCVPPQPGYLEGLVSTCEAHGALAIFDEVMTGCRVAQGGAQERYGVRPHLTALGKIVGGGMPLAAYGGRASIMQKIAPLGPVYQAGTLSGNPVAVAAGMKTLELLGARVYEQLEQRGAQLQAGLEAALVATSVTGCVQRVGSMLTVFFHAGPVRNWSDAAASDKARFAKWHTSMLQRGIYWPPSQFEAAFIGAAHTTADIDRTIGAARDALAEVTG
jgi:glutamate-1-semialdehyde 2,1-aminomutase